MEERTVVMPEGPAGAGGPEATQVMTTPPGGYGYGEATQQAITVTCPVCSTPNPPVEQYCQDCGLLFTSVSGGVEQLPDATVLPRLLDAGGREFLLNPGVNTVGRESADVLLPDGTVSRRHAHVILEDDRVMVEDLGSTNGTSVAGQPVRPGTPVPAYEGDAIRFGSVSLTVTIPGGGARPAALAAPAPAAEAAAPAADRGTPVGSLALPDGTEFPLYSGVNTLGRRSTNQIVIPDPFASGAHAEVRVEGSAVTLVDLGSTNGTFIAGERVAAQTPIAIHDGMSVTFGKTPVSFRLEGSSEGSEEASAPPAVEETPVPDRTINV